MGWLESASIAILSCMNNVATANSGMRAGSGARRSLRPVVVAESLARLRGPHHGLVEPPQRLCRSGGRRVFDMGDIGQVLDLYESMLETARTQDDLAEHVNGEGRIARGISAPGFHGSVRNSLPLHGSCRPGHLAAGFTQAQCAKYCGRLSAASMSILVAFLQVLRFLYLFMTHRIR